MVRADLSSYKTTEELELQRSRLSLNKRIPSWINIAVPLALLLPVVDIRNNNSSDTYRVMNEISFPDCYSYT